MRRILTLGAMVVSSIYAQSPPAFDVASVKRDPWPGNSYVGITVRGDTLRADHTCLDGLVSFAYNLRDAHLSGGPSWAKCGLLAASDLYQVTAKTAVNPAPSMDQFRLMLQGLLAERFQLKVRHIQKELPIYNLVVAAHGARLKESAADAKHFMNMDSRLNHGKSLKVIATHVSMAELVTYCEHWAGRPTFDHTGLSGFYDFEAAWDIENATTDAPGPEAVGQTFAMVLEKQLGLKLESGAGAFDTIVIEQAVKPSEN